MFVIPKPMTQERLEEILTEYGLFDDLKETASEENKAIRIAG
jgi:hypothetical protein